MNDHVRLMRRLAALLVAGVLVLSSTTAAHGGGDDVGLDPIRNEDGTPTTGVTDPGSSGENGNQGGNEPVYTVPEPYWNYAYVPYCPTNGPPGSGGEDNLCYGFSSCPQPEGHTGPAAVNRWWVWRMLMNPDGTPATGEWERDGVACRGADDPPQGGPEVITVADIRAAVEGVVPVPSVAVEPAGGTYVNVPTNFVADASDLATQVDVLGVTVQIQFTATDTRWSFGDGSSGTGNGIRNASVGQPGAVEHDYRRAGTYTVTVTRTYSVTFSLPNGQSESMDGFSRTSPGLALPVGEVHSLVTEVD